MLLKVCGMKHPENMRALGELTPDYMGLIFYPKSPRNVEGELAPAAIPELEGIRRTGVFVNAEIGYVQEKVQDFSLAAIQLHGQESPEYCANFQGTNVQVIKAFSVGKDGFDFNQLLPYQEVVDYFLFDTKGKHPGGNGVTFRWELLDDYKMKKPFFLSGGIGLDQVKRLKTFHHPLLFAIDVNSQFEVEPGLKDIEKVRTLQEQLKG